MARIEDPSKTNPFIPVQAFAPNEPRRSPIMPIELKPHHFAGPAIDLERVRTRLAERGGGSMADEVMSHISALHTAHTEAVATLVAGHAQEIEAVKAELAALRGAFAKVSADLGTPVADLVRGVGA